MIKNECGNDLTYDTVERPLYRNFINFWPDMDVLSSYSFMSGEGLL